MFKTFIQAIRRTTIGFEYDLRNPIAVSLDNIPAAIAAAWVHDNILNFGINLSND
jgi:hypothetical protein